MISFMKTDIACGELLFADDFSSCDLSKNWEVTGGQWEAKDGILIGRYRGNGGGLIYSRQQFPGDILLDFYGTMLSPCDNDLNFTFRADGWDYQKNDASVGYIGGLNGWWTKQAGIERYPSCELHAMSGFRGVSGKEYHIQTGIIGKRCFLAVDGEVVVELGDPDPIHDPKCNRVGLGTYCSQIAFRDFKVYRPVVTPVDRTYVPKF